MDEGAQCTRSQVKLEGCRGAGPVGRKNQKAILQRNESVAWRGQQAGAGWARQPDDYVFGCGIGKAHEFADAR